MGYLKVTTDAKNINIEFNDESAKVGGIVKTSVRKSALVSISLSNDSVNIVANEPITPSWKFCEPTSTNNQSLRVSEVDGRVISSLGELYQACQEIFAQAF